MLTRSEPQTTWVTLSTAHPAKFSDAVDLALQDVKGFDFDKDVLPPQLRELQGMKKRIYRVSGEQGVRDLIEKVKKGEHHTAGEGAASI